MKPNKVVPENVFKFMEKASRLYGDFKRKEFCEDMFTRCNESVTDSPIEQLFFVAIHALAESMLFPLNPDPTFDTAGRPECSFGLYLDHQFKIGKYTADFVLSQHKFDPTQSRPPIVIELDGHAFHDRDKVQRSYEKARDRFFVKNGYRVLHYTGSDIAADPFKAAFEALQMIGAIDEDDGEYDPKNPLGNIFA